MSAETPQAAPAPAASAASAGSNTSAGVIHDIGYQRYTGARLGRGYALRSLYTHGVRSAFGFGRSAKAKVFPWIIVGLITMVAVVLTVIRSQTGRAVITYWQFISPIAILIILFCAVVAPELVSRDLRGGVLPLYFSRPLTRVDYAVAKLAALLSAVFLLIVGPQTLMFIGGAFTLDKFSDLWGEFGRYTAGVAAAAVYALVFGALSLLIASLAGRRAVAAALIAGAFLITTPVYGVLAGLAFQGSDDGQLTGSHAKLFELAGLVSPMPLVANVGRWWFGQPVQGGEPDPLGPYGPLYGGVALALFVLCGLLLLLRYRRVAR
jgi:ABC-2 type transport system permease protein